MKELSGKMWEVVEYMDRGFTARETADRMGVSVGYVRQLRNEIRHRFDMKYGDDLSEAIRRHVQWVKLNSENLPNNRGQR